MQKTRYALMLESDGDDRYITQETIKASDRRIPLKFVSNSDELFPYISIEGEPALILLSYNSRPLNGVEMLKQLRANPSYRHIPIVMLSENHAETFVKECYRLGANTCVAKPSSLEQTKQKIDIFFKYWFEVAEV